MEPDLSSWSPARCTIRPVTHATSKATLISQEGRIGAGAGWRDAGSRFRNVW